MNLEDIIIEGLSKSATIKNKTYSIEEVYEAIKDEMFATAMKTKKSKKGKGTYLVKNPHRVLLDGDMVKANSQRLQLFYTKGFKCVVCGTEGKFFIKVKGVNEKVYHLELVGITPEGKYVLMTKDHIVPKSRGGKDELENYQTMCCICNGAKGNDPDEYIKGDLETLKESNKQLWIENKQLKNTIEQLKAENKKLKNKNE